MVGAQFDVVGIGNAIVDVLAHADEKFLFKYNLIKGSMTLVDSINADKLYKKMIPTLECSGGSAANTIASLASLGGQGAFIGKVSNDKLGETFKKDIQSLGIFFETPFSIEGESTARCLIFVTPDADRTMQTFLGSCVNLGPLDIDPNIIKNSQITYLEGYLWDPPDAKKAFKKASDLAHDSGNLVALSLSDPFCVDRYREEFINLIKNYIDIVFANEDEICSLYQVDTFEEALERVRDKCKITVLTRGEKGSVIISDNKTDIIRAVPVKDVVDTTGAGDAYAAGFLFGLTKGKSLKECGRIGSISSSEVISHFGARPVENLANLI